MFGALGSDKDIINMRVSEYVNWILRWWPCIILVEVAFLHIGLIKIFLFDSSSVNELFGLITQLAGGLFILYSIDSNLNLFGKSSLLNRFFDLMKSFPMKRDNVVLEVQGTAHSHSSTEANLVVHLTPKTIEEKIEHLQLQVDQLRTVVTDEVRFVSNRLSDLDKKTDQSINRLHSEILAVEGKVVEMSISGLDIQIFGVLLLVYGSFSSYSA